jgi:ABC-type uncharacterized transport system involved in gliding motility auxiliary subunit
MANQPDKSNSGKMNKEPFQMKWTRQQLAEICLSIGVALLIASYIRYTIQGSLLHLSEGLLIGGGVLIVASIVLGFENLRRYFSKRSSQMGTNTAILTLAVIAILVVVNYLGQQYHKRFDLTTEKLYTLSDQTQTIMKGLKKDVTVVRFAKTSDQTFDDLMGEYKHLNSHFTFQDVDPQEKPDVAKEYGATHMGDIVVASGDRKEHIEPGMGGQPSEQDITSGIMKVTRGQVKMVCFVTGHGEKSLTDNDGSGYSDVDQGLKREGFNTNSIPLVGSANGVPSNCDVLVIAGPKKGLFPEETAMVSKYLDGGGKVLIEEDPISEKSQQDPNLGSIYQAWNITVGTNIVVDVSGIGRLVGTGPAAPVVVDYGDSPITKNLKGGMTFFPLARTVAVADKSKTETQGTDLLKTSARSFTIPNLDQKEVKFDPKTDTPGPLTLGVAADRSTEGKQARLVVIGNSNFAANQFIGSQENGDLFFNTIDWLAQDENLISIRPKSVTNRHISLTEAQWSVLRWLDFVLLPGFVVVAGVWIWWKRR